MYPGLVALFLLLFTATTPITTAPAHPLLPLNTTGCRQESVAFVDVDVATMAEAGTLRGQTVIVQDGRIKAIGDSRSTPLPAGATIIEAHGRVLVPGLTDAHVHLNLDAERWMPLFIANGVTTVLNQRGGPEHIALRTAVANCGVLGPTIYTSGPFTNQPEVRDSGDAIRAVRAQKAAGYDFLKIHGDLTEKAYAALINEGRRQGFAITGHAPRNLTFAAVLDRRQAMVAHAEELIYTQFRQLDQGRIPALADRMARSGTWLIPTLSTFRNIVAQWGTDIGLDEGLGRGESAYLTPAMERYWRSNNPYLDRPRAGVGRVQAMYEFQMPLVKALFDAGVPLMAGTDTPLPVMYPGFSIHDEIAELVRAGIPPLAALATATQNPGDFVRKHIDSTVRFGRVEVGYRADLVLVEGDPTKDPDSLRRPVGVMLRGVWYDRAALDGLLRNVSESGVR
jgi:amidohydrolase family protein